MTIDLNDPDRKKTALSIAPEPEQIERPPLLADVMLLPLVDPEFLIEDAVEIPCTGSIIGASGTGKSFFALDLAFHVAAGKAWNGKKVREGAVIYAAGEGRHAIPRRYRAWAKKHGGVPVGTFFCTTATVAFDDAGLAPLMDELDTLATLHPPALIVVDTMARALPPEADENSNKDMGALIHQLDMLRDRYSCTVLVVHHTGWSEGAQRRGRGASAVKGAMDLEILLADGKIEWIKTKDMDPHPTLPYSLEKVQYGDRPKDSSCVIGYGEAVDPHEEQLTKVQKMGLETLNEAIAKTGGIATNLDTWRECFYDANNGTEPTNRKNFNNAKKQLIGLQVVSEKDGVFTLKNRSKLDAQVEDAMFGHLTKTSK
jgi:hypothetical protein